MEMYAVLSTLFACIAMALGLYNWYRRPKGMPPGPRGLPFVGAIPFLGFVPWKTLFEWKKTYGSVITVRFGRLDWVILNDYKITHQALVKAGDSFLDRPVIPVLEIGTQGHGLAILKYGDKWKTQRKFTIMTLRGFGMGKRSIEDRIREEAAYMCGEIRNLNGKPSNLSMIFAKAISNSVCSIVFGRRFDYTDPWLCRLLQYVDKKYHDKRTNAATGIMVFVPWLQYIPPFNKVVQELTDEIDDVMRMFEKEVQRHRDTFQPDDIRDFIDAYLVELDVKKTETFSHPQLLHLIRELFEASADTQTSTLLWFVLCLIHYPETQEKLHKEIMEMFGSNGKPCVAMRPEMPYTSAFIQESMRFRSLNPLGIIHHTNNTVELDGYVIPKGTTVVLNQWAMHNDPDVWKDPETFNPERHLDPDGRFVSNEQVVTFSTGPRSCPGKQLATTKIFLFLVSLVQKFHFVPGPAGLPDINKASSGFVYTPLPFEVIAEEREY